jgi:hypothetical protein
MTFPVLIFTKLINAQQWYVQISYNKFYPNWTVNLANKGIYIQARRAAGG